ncbi:MAG: PEP-CTERM sorting domain-containing protein [Vicinamibacterales bacterium]
MLEPLGWTWDPVGIEYDVRGARNTAPFLNFSRNQITTFWLGDGSNPVWHSMLVFDPVDHTARTWVVRDGGNPYARMPEPSSFALVGLGAAVAGALRLRGTVRRKGRA